MTKTVEFKYSIGDKIFYLGERETILNGIITEITIKNERIYYHFCAAWTIINQDDAYSTARECLEAARDYCAKECKDRIMRFEEDYKMQGGL